LSDSQAFTDSKEREKKGLIKLKQFKTNKQTNIRTARFPPRPKQQQLQVNTLTFLV